MFKKKIILFPRSFVIVILRTARLFRKPSIPSLPVHRLKGTDFHAANLLSTARVSQRAR